ncbi:MAG: DegT/DnrJ/EryC1/StrS family aminotransferase [Pseudomonadota bacterium]|nr:DegT/DnrJ/EryC1/StrS family aminotransferase [Pseudomonadota bacterium]
MKEFSYPLATATWDNAEYDAMQRVIKSGNFTMGQEVSNFEKRFSEFHDRKYSVMVNSGSSANLLMIASLFFKKDNPLMAGDEVIVPAISWSTTYAPLVQYGLKIKFVDVDIDTMNLNLDQLAAAISEETKLIFLVNLLGNPNDFDKIYSITEGRNIYLIEDNCEALGGEYQDTKTGCFGIMSSFSSFFSHHISTMEGGLVLTGSEELYQILLCLRAHGWTRDLPKENHLTGIKNRDQFEESFNFILPGYNLRPLEMSGAIGGEQLKKLTEIIRGRRMNAEAFQDIMGGHPLIKIQKEIGKSSWFGFSLVVRPDVDYSREQLRKVLDSRGFEYRPIVAGNFVEQKVVKYMNYECFDKLVNATTIQRNGLFIGNHHYDVSSSLQALSDL